MVRDKTWPRRKMHHVLQVASAEHSERANQKMPFFTHD
jgi:hypothetical protein